jgi:hypothetical protein
VSAIKTFQEDSASAMLIARLLFSLLYLIPLEKQGLYFVWKRTLAPCSSEV